MSFPLYLDADVHPIVARILRDRGFDAVSANEAGRREASDREQLDFADIITVYVSSPEEFEPDWRTRRRR